MLRDAVGAVLAVDVGEGEEEGDEEQRGGDEFCEGRDVGGFLILCGVVVGWAGDVVEGVSLFGTFPLGRLVVAGWGAGVGLGGGLGDWVHRTYGCGLKDEECVARG